jgi:hypothetical protein
MKIQSLARKSSVVLVVTILLVGLSFTANAATFYAIATGNWSTPGTWSSLPGGGTPTWTPGAANTTGYPGSAANGDVVIIERGVTVTLDVSPAYTISTVQLGGSLAIPNNAGTLNMSTNTLTVTSTFKLGGAGGTTGGSYAHGYLNFVAGSILTVKGVITYGYSTGNTFRKGWITFTTGGLLEVAESFAATLNIGTFTAGSGTVAYTKNGVQTVIDVLSSPYNNLTLAGTGPSNVKTATGVDVNGVLSLEGSATVSGAMVPSASSTIQYKGSVAQTTGSELGNADGNQVFQGSGGVIINNASGVSLKAYTDVDINGNLEIYSTLTLTEGNFNVGSNALTLDGPTIAGTPSNLQTTSNSNLVFVNSTSNIAVPSSVTSLNRLSYTSTSATKTLSINSNIVCDYLTIAGKIITGSNMITTRILTSGYGGVTAPIYKYVNGYLGHTFPAAANE